MASVRKHLLGTLLVSGVLSYGLGACTSDTNTGTSTGAGGNGGSGAGGVTSSGGHSSVTSSGGSQGGTTSSSGGQAGSSSSSKGGDSTGGKTSETASTGGTSAGGSSGSQVSSSGGSARDAGAKGGAGGAGTTGAGGTPDGGGPATGGKAGAGSGGASGAGGSSGGCQKGGFKGSELVIFGESFYDWSPPYIKQRIEENARKAGSLGANDSYRQVAVAGQNMNYIATTEYDKAVAGGKFTKVVMDGGGIDCMSSSCPTCPDTLKGLFDKFAKEGVDQVIYTRYPEPGNPPGSNASLKKNLDALMPNMQKVCEGATNLKCYWVDLRPVFVNGDTSDGLHPTKSGGDHVGDAIWAEMVKQCMAQ